MKPEELLNKSYIKEIVQEHFMHPGSVGGKLSWKVRNIGLTGQDIKITWQCGSHEDILHVGLVYFFLKVLEHLKIDGK